MARPDVDIPGYDPRTPEQKLASYDAKLRQETVAAIVKDLEEYLPEWGGMSAKMFLSIIARIKRHADKPRE